MQLKVEIKKIMKYITVNTAAKNNSPDQCKNQPSGL